MKRKIIFGIVIVFGVLIYLFANDKQYTAQPIEIRTDVLQTVPNFISSKNYIETMKTVVVPFINSHEHSNYFNSNNARLFYKTYEVEKPKANVVIVHGFTEQTTRYQEIIYYLLKQNYSVYIYDQRGHGLSDRLSESDYMVCIDKFDNYTDDLKNFIDTIVPKSPQLFLYGHSMGGAVVTDYIEKYPDDAKLAVLSAPMHSIVTKPFPPHIASLYSSTMNMIGFKNKYCPGHSDFDEQNIISGDDYRNNIRTKYFRDLEIKNKKLITSGGSFGWVHQSQHATKSILRLQNLNKITIPVVLFQSQNDKTVSANGQNKFKTYVKSCTLYRFQNAPHNIYMADDKTFSAYMSKLLETIDSYML